MKISNLPSLVLLVFLGLVATSCSTSTSGIPAAIGSAGKITIIMPSGLKAGPAGKLLDSLLRREASVLPREEYVYDLRYVNPETTTRSHKNLRNIIFAFTFDDQSPEAGKVKSMIESKSLEMLQANPDGYVHTQSDVFARGQEVMFLFGPNAETLEQNLRANGKRISDYFNEKEKQRLRTGILKSNANQALTEQIEKKFGFNIRIPFGYQLADQQKDFVWLRQINPADDKDIWIARKKFTSMEDFSKDQLIRFRNDVCGKYLFEDPEKPDTYLVTETRVSSKPVTIKTINFNGFYAVEMRGLWRTNIPSMGGPFLGYALVDEAAGWFYYIEGFVFSPSKPQREIIREMEVILNTFKFSASKESKIDTLKNSL
ncbi:MAG: DUF4837 family protein [Bacteroidetes bacterium]|nr:DUF4837 family protein [Bacteroidota bacterium]